MISNLKIKILLAALIGVAFTSPLSAQKPSDEITKFSKKKKDVLDRPAWQLNVPKRHANKDTLESENHKEAKNQMAHFMNWEKYVSEHLKYPELAREYNVEGIVQAEIDINPFGEIMSVKIVQGLGFGCNEAVVDLLCHMPRWQPSLKNGQPIAQKLSIPLQFSLQ